MIGWRRALLLRGCAFESRPLQLIDKLILPGDDLDKEIADDKNWGAALIEGAVAIGIAVRKRLSNANGVPTRKRLSNTLHPPAQHPCVSRT